MDNFKLTLFKFLDIAGYEEDKDAFIEKFSSLCFYKAVMDLLSELSPEERESLEKKLKSETDAKKLIDFCKKRFGEESFKIALKQNMKSCFLNIYTAVTPTLSKERKQNLDNFISSFSA